MRTIIEISFPFGWKSTNCWWCYCPEPYQAGAPEDPFGDIADYLQQGGWTLVPL